MRRWIIWATLTAIGVAAPVKNARSEVTAEEVRTAITRANDYLKRQQRGDGSWPGHETFEGGSTALAVLALLTAGVAVDDPAVQRGLDYLRKIESEWTYVVALQTMAFCAADPRADAIRIQQNVAWLERTQIKAGRFPGTWSYGTRQGPPSRGDNSNTQYALLALRDASEVGFRVNPEVWERSRNYLIRTQTRDGGWSYTADVPRPTGSMTAAGLSGLVITGLKLNEGHEKIKDGVIENCGAYQRNVNIDRALNWLGMNFQFAQNPNAGTTWTFYYLYGLERAGRLTGQRFFGRHDWYREVADFLVKFQDPLTGRWLGNGNDEQPVVATCFALLFLSKGRYPVVINKLKHGPGMNAGVRFGLVRGGRVPDWDTEPDDVRNLVEYLNRQDPKWWNIPATWQAVDPQPATVEDLLQAPIVFVNGQHAPVFTAEEKKKLQDYVSQGGFIFAEAACGQNEFDTGFRALMKELFPDNPLHPLPASHPVWTAAFPLTPEAHPLWGVEIGCRTSIIYSPAALSSYWQKSGEPAMQNDPHVIKAMHVGANVVAYATGKEVRDKLEKREVVEINPKEDTLVPNALRVAKLRQGRDAGIAPLAMPMLMAHLRAKLNLDVQLAEREIGIMDPNLFLYPFVYMHGRSQFALTAAEKQRLRQYLERGGFLFADAACGSEAFDTSFRELVAALFPDHKLQRIPLDNRMFKGDYGYDLSTVSYSKGAGGQNGPPFLEGVEINGRYVLVYSKYDVGCALERQAGIDCKGYTHESALKIATNIVLYCQQQ